MQYTIPTKTLSRSSTSWKVCRAQSECSIDLPCGTKNPASIPPHSPGDPYSRFYPRFTGHPQTHEEKRGIRNVEVRPSQNSTGFHRAGHFSSHRYRNHIIWLFSPYETKRVEQRILNSLAAPSSSERGNSGGGRKRRGASPPRPERSMGAGSGKGMGVLSCMMKI